MEHFFELQLEHKGKTRSFNGRLVTFGYSYKFYIIVNGRELVFEKDDEQQYRVLGDGTDGSTSIDISLVEAIIIALQSIAKAG